MLLCGIECKWKNPAPHSSAATPGVGAKVSDQVKLQLPPLIFREGIFGGLAVSRMESQPKYPPAQTDGAGTALLGQSTTKSALFHPWRWKTEKCGAVIHMFHCPHPIHMLPDSCLPFLGHVLRHVSFSSGSNPLLGLSVTIYIDSHLSHFCFLLLLLLLPPEAKFLFSYHVFPIATDHLQDP